MEHKKSVCKNMEGMSLSEAERYAKEKGYEIRVAERNGSSNFVTTDYRSDRVSVKIKGDKVIEANIN